MAKLVQCPMCGRMNNAGNVLYSQCFTKIIAKNHPKYLRNLKKFQKYLALFDQDKNIT